MKLPNEIGPIHFVGIGGIGMSGIAEVLINLGHDVQGSDASDNANVKRLRERGAKVFVGHDPANLGAAAVVVVSTAIKRDNPELAAARVRRIPVVRRAEMLAELMRLKRCVAVAGTHGKTTTTSLVATLLDAAGLDPTVINGGIINAYGTNARLGAGDWMVVEADESDGTFLKLPADVAIVTNVDPEHLDHFKTFDAIKDAFLALIENLPFYGFAVMCLDHPTVQELVGRIEDRRVLTYGENPQADIRLLDVAMDGRRHPLLRSDPRAGDRPGHLYRRSRAADARPAQCAQRHRRHCGRARARRLGRRHPQGDRRLRRRQAALHPHRGMERGLGLRRLRPPSGRDRGRPQGRPRGVDRQGDRGRAAAPLHPACFAVRRLRDLLQRRRQRDRRRRLSGRRGADRGRRQERAGGRDRRPRPPACARPAVARQARAHDSHVGRARRLCRLPRRRHDHAMGLRAAGRTRGARPSREGVSR